MTLTKRGEFVIFILLLAVTAAAVLTIMMQPQRYASDYFNGEEPCVEGAQLIGDACYPMGSKP